MLSFAMLRVLEGKDLGTEIKQSDVEDTKNRRKHSRVHHIRARTPEGFTF